MGYAYYYKSVDGEEELPNVTLALSYAERAIQLGDTQADWLYEACKNRIQLLNREDEEDVAQTELITAFTTYLDCPYQYFSPMKDDDPIMAAYHESLERGKTEGFTPMLIVFDEVLREAITDSTGCQKKHDGDSFDIQKILQYRDAMLSQPLPDYNEVIHPILEQLKKEAIEYKFSWEKDILGEQKDGEENDRFLSFWNYQTEKTLPLLLVEIPVLHPWEIFSWLPFGGWNECPNTAGLMSITKHWYECFHAIPAVMTSDQLEFYLPAPVDKQDAMQLALEHYAFCPDVIDQGPEDATVGSHADSLSKSTSWYFWWD